MTSRPRCRSRSWALTTDQNSSTTTCGDGANAERSPSPGRGRPTRTTAVTSSRKTGRWCAPWSATTATTPPQSVVTQRDLAAAVQADQLEETRQGSHPVPPRDRSPKHDRGAHRGADPDLLPDQSRRHLTPDPSPDRSTPHHHHKQGRTHHQSPSQQARTFT